MAGIECIPSTGFRRTMKYTASRSQPKQILAAPSAANNFPMNKGHGRPYHLTNAISARLQLEQRVSQLPCARQARRRRHGSILSGCASRTLSSAKQTPIPASDD